MEERMDFSKIILRVYKAVALICFFLILCLLTAFSACSTSYLAADSTELTFFVKDYRYVNLLAVAAVVAALILLGKNKAVADLRARLNEDEVYFAKVRRCLLSVIAVLGCIWVLATQYMAKSDQILVQYGAYMLHYKDYALFREAGYLARCQNQLGLVWISYLLSFVFGNYNFVAFQLLNVAALAIIYREMAEIGAYSGLKRSGQTAVYLLGILFFPLTMYCSFVYGTVPGLALSLVAIRQGILFLQSRKWQHGGWSVLAMTAAVLMKTNYVIFMIGLVITAVMVSLKKRQPRLLVFPVILAACCMLQSNVLAAVTERVTGQTLNAGSSAWAYVSMGLQDTAGSAGWWNGYNEDSYIGSSYDAGVQAKEAKEDIGESLKRFTADRHAAVQFFSEKIASQWNNPTFQSYWIAETSTSGIEESGLVWAFTSPKGSYYGAGYLNLLQFVILAGALFYCMSACMKGTEPEGLILAIVFAGGFLFHIVWEAKAQYALPYFVLLFPYTVRGLEQLAACAASWKNRLREGQTVSMQAGRTRQFWVIAGCGIVLLIFLAGTVKLTPVLTADTQRYDEYLSEVAGEPALADGSYYFHTASGAALGWSTKEDGTGTLLICDADSDSAAVISAASYRDKTWLSLAETDLYLTAETEYSEWTGKINAEPSANSDGQVWMVRTAEDGGVFILTDASHALTYDETSHEIYLAEFTREANQIWYTGERPD